MSTSAPGIGEHWVYRKSDNAASERVKILGLTEQGRKQRAEIKFVDVSDRVETVPLNRLRTPWSNVQSFDESMANWEKLAAPELHAVEEDAIGEVFGELFPESVTTIYDRRPHYVVSIHDAATFEDIVGCSIADIARQCFSCREGDTVLLCRNGALLSAELACRRNSQPILDIVFTEETEAREACKHGRSREYGRRANDSDRTSPYWEWDWYLEHTRPRLELLRQWCGFRAVTADERRRAAEKEARRLDLLLTRAIDTLKDHHELLASVLEQEHESERITPERVRPQIDRPLRPDEMPVREIKVRSRRWW
ncbi:hypothetical protein K3M35_16840 [Rhodococcus sp. DMU2021]|uniref:hypothetical protein n=1 Tax=Rhodococcus sp. DMU2021 TaxID=2866997 RepID=UPI001C7D4B06|nr:hypothetical protein [Rhodococcus sp. DMU2021]MBX4170304.1 hypothetical protein [Rhodococcus sp. DMU2021]